MGERDKIGARSGGVAAQQVPLWADHLRALPATFVRSALFSVGGKHERRVCAQEVIACLPDAEISYSGTELRIDDQDVIAQLYHMARGAILSNDAMADGVHIEFSGNAMLNELGWPRTSRGYAKLKASLERLQRGTLKVTREVSGKRKTFAGQIIRKFVTTEDQSRAQWKVWLEPEMLSLFLGFLAFDWEVRLRLQLSLSKWLHALFSGEPNNRVFTIGEALLRTLSGSRVESPRKFRQTLKEAMDELVRQKAIHQWCIDHGMVRIARMPGLLAPALEHRSPMSKLPLQIDPDQEELQMFDEAV